MTTDQPKPQLESKPQESSPKERNSSEWEDEKPSHPNIPVAIWILS